MIYSINYDLNRPGQNYAGLHYAIKALGPHIHVLKSTSLVETNLSAAQVWKRFRPHVDKTDHVLVNSITRKYSGRMPPHVWERLRERRSRLAA